MKVELMLQALQIQYSVQAIIPLSIGTLHSK